MSTRYDDRDYGLYGERSGRSSGREREQDYETSGRGDYQSRREFDDYQYRREGQKARRGYGREPSQGDYDRGYGRQQYQREYNRGYGSEGSYGSSSFGGGSPRDSFSGWSGRGEYDYERRSYEPSKRYSQRYNYPSGYRSGESYGGRYEGYEGSQGERGWWDRAADEVSSWFGDEEAERRRRMDEQRARHRGRGPKGYRRSDERIKEDINDRLSDDYYLDATDIEVSVSNSEVTLTGTVDSRIDKRRAEDIAEAVSGVTNVENRLRVQHATMGTAGSIGTSQPSGTVGAKGVAAGGGIDTTGSSSTARGRGAST